MTLDQIAIKHGTDKATKHPLIDGHCYTPHYDDYFRVWRQLPVKVLEIGVAGGESIRTWLEYFPNAQVCGIDNNPDCARIDDPRYEFVLGDQASDKFLDGFIQSHWFLWDIVIDDGSHEPSHIETTFNRLWAMLKPGGLYCIEDVFVFYNVNSPPAGGAFLSSLTAAVHHTAWPEHLQLARRKDVASIWMSKGLVIVRKVL